MDIHQIQKLLDINPDPVFIADRKTGKVLFSNQIFISRFRYKENLENKTLFEIVPASESEKMHSLLEGRINQGEFYFKFKEGKLVRHQIYVDEFDEDSVIISFKGRINPSNANFYRELVNKLNDAVISTNLNLEITSWNKAAEKMYGWAEIEALGEIISELLCTQTTDSANKSYLFDLEVSGSVQQIVTGRHKNGNPVFTETNVIDIYDINGVISGYLFINRDISARLDALEKLKQSEEKYRLLFERNPMPMFVYDEETYYFLAANDVAMDHYGYTKNEFLQKTIKDIRPSEDVPALINILAKQGPGNNKFTGWRHSKKDGTIIYVDITTHRILYNGKPARIVLANDISDKVKAEKALRESEKKYRIIVENANEGILLVDEKEKVTFVNSKFAEIVGYGREEIENSPVMNLIFDEDKNRAYEYIAQNRDGARETFEFRFKHKNGSERWITANAVPVFDENNNYTSGLALITDITEQRKAETVLHRTNEMLRALINYSPLGIIILDKDGKTELWNPASEKIFGWSSKEVLGRMLPFVPDEKAEEHLQLRKTVMNGETFTGREVIRRTKDGKKINVSVSAAPLFDSVQKPIGISSFIIDVTERKIAEKEREKLFKQINAARNRLKILSAQLISVQEAEKRNISVELHDEIGQMLTAIKIDLQRIRNNFEKNEITILVDDCSKLVEKTISVVRNLSRELRPSIIDDLGLAASLRWYTDQFHQRTGVTIKTRIKKVDEAMPPECAITLFRICQEALTNIAKHSGADYVKITLYKHKSFITLTVEDNGKGFDLQKALRLASKGKSLGLLGMQERAELLGGKFRIKSAPGSGTLIKATCQV